MLGWYTVDHTVVFGFVYSGGFRHGDGDFQLFGHHAASHVCHVFFHDNHDADRWLVYAHRQHAGLDAMVYGGQSVEILYPGHAVGLFEGQCFH